MSEEICKQCGKKDIPGTLFQNKDGSWYRLCRFCHPEPLQEEYKNKAVREILEEPCCMYEPFWREHWQWIKQNLDKDKKMNEIWVNLPQVVQIMLSYELWWRSEEKRKRKWEEEFSA